MEKNKYILNIIPQTIYLYLADWNCFHIWELALKMWYKLSLVSVIWSWGSKTKKKAGKLWQTLWHFDWIMCCRSPLDGYWFGKSFKLNQFVTYNIHFNPIPNTVSKKGRKLTIQIWSSKIVNYYTCAGFN